MEGNGAMRAFFYANHNAESFDDSARRIVGRLDALDPGAYIITATAAVGTSVAYGYPTTTFPYGYGVFTLSFGGATDLVYAGLRPEDAQNHETVALMVAAEISKERNARLYFQTVYPLKMTVYSVRLAAVQVDELRITEEGRDTTTDPQREEDEARAALLKGVLLDPSSAIRLTSLIRHDPDDD
jgi:hypothetical protein